VATPAPQAASPIAALAGRCTSGQTTYDEAHQYDDRSNGRVERTDEDRRHRQSVRRRVEDPPEHGDQEVAHRHAGGQITEHTPGDR
jgi:hypothetical protein